jgi:hypothetical protein
MKKIRARLRKNPDLEYWKKVFQGVSESPFLRGDNGTFKATLDWLIKNDTNSQKVYEGQYAEEKPRPYRGGGGDKAAPLKKYDGTEEVLRSGN